MKTAVLSANDRAIIRRELSGLGYTTPQIATALAATPNQSAASRRSDAVINFDQRIRYVARLATTHLLPLPPAQIWLNRFLAGEVNLLAIKRNAVAVSLDLRQLLCDDTEQVRRKQHNLKRTAQANVVGFFQEMLGDKFSSTFFLCVSPHQAWDIFWMRVVGEDADGTGQPVWEDAAALHTAYRQHYKAQQLYCVDTQWPTTAAKIMEGALCRLLRSSVTVQSILPAYYRVFARSIGMDEGSYPGCTLTAEELVEGRISMSIENHMRQVLTKQLAEPRAVAIFTVVAQHFGAEHQAELEEMFPVQSPLVGETDEVHLDSPLTAIFKEATDVRYVNTLESNGLTTVRSLCLLAPEGLGNIYGLRNQARGPGSLIIRRLQAVGLQLGMSLEELINWEKTR